MGGSAQFVARKIAEAFCRRYSQGIYAPGRSDYYNFAAFPESDDGHKFSLRITFKSGERYCCAESACHFDFWSAHGWQLIRDELAAVGLNATKPLHICTVRVTVEEGAELGLRYPGDDIELERSKGYFYEIGPFREDTPETE